MYVSNYKWKLLSQVTNDGPSLPVVPLGKVALPCGPDHQPATQ